VEKSKERGESDGKTRENEERDPGNPLGINISAELADVLQAEQERWRNRRALLSRPSYTELIETDVGSVCRKK
jgi:hypothetical protein